MLKNPGLALVCLLFAAGFISGCKPKSAEGPSAPAPAPAPPAAYFQTPFQDESQFIVQAIVSDLAEQMVYAASQRLPDPKSFSVTATEKPGSPVDAPVYELQVRLEPNQPELKLELPISGPIWSAEVYQCAAAKLARLAGLSAGQSRPTPEARLAPKLADGTPETIAQADQELSAALEKDFRNPELHEQAALLLGAFMLRDNSGSFFEIRCPLSRLTAHLAMARFLRGAAPYGPDGRLAEATLLHLVGDTGPALARLDALGTNSPALAPFVRALRAYNTGDYRPLEETEPRSALESVAWFAVRAGYVNLGPAWEKLTDEQKQTVDFVRVANALGCSVQIGHVLLQQALRLEWQETTSVYERYQHEPLAEAAAVAALNALPEGCLGTNGAGQLQVHVLGWGQWAHFLQRHLCHAIQHNYGFLADKWGVPEKAAQFSAACDLKFAGLRLYPFVRRFNCNELLSYRRAVDEGFKVTVATPHLVPAECWNYLCYQVRFAPLYRPVPNPHINEWHRHNPPPGTVYDLDPRLNHPSLTGRPDFVARLEQLHELAPCDCRLARWIISKKYNNQATCEQARALYGAVLPYSRAALCAVAHTACDQPEQYEKLMLQAAALDPSSYYELSTYARDHNQTNQADQYLEKACAADTDAVRVANHAEWRVYYRLSQGQTNEARDIADAAAEVYSYVGLRAKALFEEWTTNYEGALEWYGKIEERYKDSSPLLKFCLDYKAQSGDTRFDAEVEQRLGQLFPKGLEKVALSEVHGPPRDGVLIQEENELLKAAGLKAGDIIVAADGIGVHNMLQYVYVRELQHTPELRLLVWQGGACREIKARPPKRRFGVQFVDYVPPKSGAR